MFDNRKVPFGIIFLSVLVALFADIKAVNWTLVHGEYIGEGIMNLMYPLVIVLIIVLAIVVKMKWGFNTSSIFLISYLLLFYWLTYLIWGPPEVNILIYLALVVIAFSIPFFSIIDTRWFLRALMILPSFAIFRLDKVFAPEADWLLSISLDASYAFLVPVIATIVYLLFYLKSDSVGLKIIMIVFGLVNLAFLFELFIRGSRGTLLCVFLLLVFLFVIRKRKSKEGVLVNRRALLLVAAVSLIVFTFSFYLSTMLLKLQSFLGVDIYAITHYLDLASTGDIDNGRNNLSALTWNGIFDSFVWGNGIDRFYANTGEIYPHNFILQILYDGGLIFFFLTLVPVTIGFVKKLRRCSYDEYNVICVLFFSSVPGSLFSISIYNNGILWMFFGAMMAKYFIRKT